MTARQVRELISSEMWEQINRLYLDLQKAGVDHVWAAPHEFFHAVEQGRHLFQGITNSTMDHGEGWHFIQLGQYIDHAGNVAGLLSAHLAHEAAGEVLRMQGPLPGMARPAAQLHRLRGLLQGLQRRPALREIAEFLLLNDSFPFSINFAASMLRTALEDIADTTDTRRHNPILRQSAGSRPPWTTNKSTSY